MFATMVSVFASLRIVRPSVYQKLGLKWLSTSLVEEQAPLMGDEVLQHLKLQNNQTVLDMTFGDGLHAELVLKSNQTIKLIALDRDPQAVKKAEVLSSKYPGRVRPIRGRFSDLPNLLNFLKVRRKSIDAIMVDVGCSSMQLNDPNRGFSPHLDGLLDMRMDGCDCHKSISAIDLIRVCGEHDLQRILRIYGGLTEGKKVAGEIVSYRYSLKPLQSTFELRDFVRNICEKKKNQTVQNVFYALRTFVNNELNELNYGMLLAQEYLKKGGRLLSITYHQNEDTIIKRHFTGNVLENSPNPQPLKYYSQSCNLSADEINELRQSPWSPLAKHVITERSHGGLNVSGLKSAKLRAAVLVKG